MLKVVSDDAADIEGIITQNLTLKNQGEIKCKRHCKCFKVNLPNNTLFEGCCECGWFLIDKSGNRFLYSIKATHHGTTFVKKFRDRITKEFDKKALLEFDSWDLNETKF